jgi:gamma-glutamyl hercynylcysteine S-oxide synthase
VAAKDLSLAMVLSGQRVDNQVVNIDTNKAAGLMNIDSPLMRRSGADVLSLALMDARNHTLALMRQFEERVPDLRFASDLSVPRMAEALPPLWLLGHVGWFQEYWISRNTQRHLGEQCPPQATRLASIEPQADLCFDPALTTRAQRWTASYPDLLSIKAYLLDTLESCLELLDKAGSSDQALYVYRMALAREDQVSEKFFVMAQSLGLKISAPELLAQAPRMPISVPASRWMLGAAEEGFAWDNERPQHAIQVPEFEIDAQPVNWSQFVEFVDDGAYDDPRWWSHRGWEWLQSLDTTAHGRGPRFVEQIGAGERGGAVLQRRFGQLQRAASGAPALHISWFEADAYARWAGRRLPTEVEWEMAASKLAGQGFRWGDVWEWTANTFSPYPGFKASPWLGYSVEHFEHCKVLRGASFATRARAKLPTYRGFARPHVTGGFYGFRTCAL